jgi:hypothetical protein
MAFKVFFAFLVCMAILLRIFVFVCSIESIPVTGDEAITWLQAKHILQGDFPLLVYAQPYEFPLETYVYAILRPMFSIRFLTLFIGVATTLLLVMLLIRAGKVYELLPGWIVLLFPGAYLIMTHFAYSTPQTAFSYIPVLLAIYIIFYLKADDGLLKKGLVIFFAGILCGLAISENFAVIAFLAPLFLALVFNEKGGKIRKAIIFMIGVASGLIPLFLALFFYPEAYSIVSKCLPIKEALSKSGILLFHSLPCALGIAPPLYPDTKVHLDFGNILLLPVACLFLALLLCVTFIRLKLFFTDLRKERKSVLLSIYDIFILATWLGIIGIIFNERFASYNLRYLHPITYSFPFLIAFLATAISFRFRTVLTLFCVALALFNILTTTKLCKEWQKPDFAEKIVDTPDLMPVANFLKANQIKYAVATHWQCYRLNFITDEEIICAQPWNERFKSWILPYKDRVDAATNVALILENKKNRYGFDSMWFFKVAHEQGIVFAHTNAGAFMVCWDFKCEEPLNNLSKLHKLPIGYIKINEEPTNTLWLYDNKRDNYNRFMFPHTNISCSITISLVHPSNAVLINLYYRAEKSVVFHIRKICFKNKLGVFEKSLPENFSSSITPFVFENNHPVFGQPVQNIKIKNINEADTLIIEGNLVLLSDRECPFTEIECYSY